MNDETATEKIARLEKEIKKLRKMVDGVIKDKSGDLDFVQWNLKNELHKLDEKYPD